MCDCSLDADNCWAHILLSAFLGSLSDRITNVPCTSAVAEVKHDHMEVTPLVTLVAIPEVIDNGLPSESVIPCALPWPPSWTSLVQRIRSLQRPVMWEIFPGMCVLTMAFAAIGISTAPPLDAAAVADYDLLNATFLAVVVGILGSHGVDLVHLAPPCSSFSIAINGSVATTV